MTFNAQTWHAQYYQRNRERLTQMRDMRRAANRSLIDSFRKVCMDCGISDPDVLEFDHARGQKISNVTGLLSMGQATILAEIAKCDVVCANCHHKRTKKRSNGKHR